MSLKTDYNLQSQMDDVYDLGVSLIQPTPTAAYTIISGELAAAAAAGETDFTVNVNHNAINDNLELSGTYWRSYSAGILTALASENIYNYEVAVVLNTTVTGTATIDLIFSF